MYSMPKKFICLLLLLINVSTYAQLAKVHNEQFHELSQEEINLAMVSPNAGLPGELPKPGEGIVVKPLKELDDEAYQRYQKSKKGLANNPAEEMQTNEPRILIDNVNLKGIDYNTYELSSNIENTEMRKSLSQLQLVYKFKEFQNSHIKTSGFAPLGMLENNKWQGAAQFFKHDQLGHCVYEKLKYDFKNGGVYLAAERTGKFVNGKLTSRITYGNNNDGYIYLISWYDNDFMSELRCANLKAEHGLNDQIVRLAKEIDKA